jgi:two-component system, NarL family, nitrate/nitrite response regulator NarL
MSRHSRLRRPSVMVADDHPLFRGALVDALKRRPDLDLVGEAENGERALEQVRALRPDVILVDARMPAVDGLEVLRSVVREELPTKVLMLSGETAGTMVSEALASGAAGYLAKTASAIEIGDAVLAAARGHAVHGHAPSVDEEDGPSPLTPRELEVLALAAEGRSGPQIGRELFVSPATVKTHLRNIYDKLGVKDRAAAVAEGMRRGLLH